MNVYLLVYQCDVIYFAFVYLFHGLLSSCFLVYVYLKTGNEIKKWRFSQKIAYRLLKYCWPLAISIFLVTVHTRIDQVMIENMMNIEDVGIYSVAVKLSEFWMFIPSILVSTLMPYFVRLREVDNHAYLYKLTQLYCLMFWMGVTVGVITVLFGQPLINVLYGDEYAGAYGALVFNIWAGIFVAQSSARGIWVISENVQRYRIIANSIAILINITLNYFLIPIYGINGAAFATLMSRFANNWITPLFIKPYRANTLASIKSINPFYCYSPIKQTGDP